MRTRLVLLAATLCLLIPAVSCALDLRVGAPAGPRVAAAQALAARLATVSPLTVIPLANDATALEALDGLALVRATSARQAFAGTGRFDKPHANLRTVAVLGSEVVHLWARPDLHELASLRGKPVAMADGAADTVRTVLALAGVGLPELKITPAPDPVQAARDGRIQAWLAVDLPASPTALALAQLGWRPLALGAAAQDELRFEGWPLQRTTAQAYAWPGVSPQAEVITVPQVLIASESVPRALVEDAVDLLFPTLDSPAGSVALLQDANRTTAAKPVPAPLHPGAAASYTRAGPLDRPIDVQVTLWMLAVSDVDVARGLFDADLTLELRWQDARLDTTLRPFEIMNATEVQADPYGYTSHGAWHAMNWRVHAKMRATFDLHRYPLDQQRLTVELEHPLLTYDELVFHCETRFGSPEVNLRKDRLGPGFALPDWKLLGVHSEEAKTTYGPGEHFSRYRFVLTVERALLPFFVRELAPILIMVLIALAGSLVPAEKIDAKLLLTVLALLVAVELQAGQAERAATVGYATLTDFAYLFAYLSISVAVLQSIIEYRLHARDRDDLAIRARNWGAVVTTLAFVLPMIWVSIARL
jgi:TRAP-type uncharacterized transport system substrate-binding protein